MSRRPIHGMIAALAKSNEGKATSIMLEDEVAAQRLSCDLAKAVISVLHEHDPSLQLMADELDSDARDARIRQEQGKRVLMVINRALRFFDQPVTTARQADEVCEQACVLALQCVASLLQGLDAVGVSHGLVPSSEGSDKSAPAVRSCRGGRLPTRGKRGSKGKAKL